jgi:hypothetical protein
MRCPYCNKIQSVYWLPRHIEKGHPDRQVPLTGPTPPKGEVEKYETERVVEARNKAAIQKQKPRPSRREFVA